MESNSKSLEYRLKKISQELASNKIELHQARGYLQGILKNSNDMIFATDVDGILVSFSKGGEKVLGYTWEEVAAHPIKDFSQNPHSFVELIGTSQAEGGAMRLEFPFRHKDGNIVYCDVSLINLNNTQGQRVGTVGVCRDITRWKKLQEELIQIDRLAETGRIASGIAHEINNPLEVINEISGWLEEEVAEGLQGLSAEDREGFQKAIRKIIDQTRRCRGITHQLLGFVRGSTPEKTEFDVHQLLRDTVSFLTPELKYSPIEMVFAFSEEPLMMKSDSKMIEQVFVNLLTNAIHAVREKGSEEGRIEIGTRKSGSNVEISIEDNGAGISEENQTKIFDLFFSTKPPGKGTGLGLSICQNIIKKLGGSINFTTSPGVGTTFTVRVPIR
jgi:two-component system NtrC family sensor kinase